MNLTFLKTTELNVKLKCSIQASGKLGFTDTTASALRLGKADRYIKFAQDTDDDNQLYMVFVSTAEDGAFKVRRSGSYYYIATQALFESMGYKYKDTNYIFDLIRMSNLDVMAQGEVYKMNRRQKERKGGNDDISES
jgi:hypothetical protein